MAVLMVGWILGIAGPERPSSGLRTLPRYGARGNSSCHGTSRRCGTCWHRERTTGWLFKPAASAACSTACVVREKSEDLRPCSDMITSDWDNVMPMALPRHKLRFFRRVTDLFWCLEVLFPKPEKAGDATLLQPRGAGSLGKSSPCVRSLLDRSEV